MKREDLLDLNEALQHPGLKQVVDVETELLNEEYAHLCSPLVGFIEAVSTGNLLMLTGEFKTTVKVECARCTEPLTIPLEFSLDEQFPVEGVASSYSSADVAKVVPDEPYELFDGNSLMVEALLRQALLIEIPIQPLCPSGWDLPCAKAAAIQAALQKKEEIGRLGELRQLFQSQALDTNDSALDENQLMNRNLKS